MQKVRIALRGKAIMIMGKNTLMRMIIREKMAANPRSSNRSYRSCGGTWA